MKDTNDQIEKWFQCYRNVLTHIIHQKLTCNTHEVEDILMEVFSRACRSLQNRSDPISHPQRWLEKITHNVCSEEIKKRDRERSHRSRSFFSEDDDSTIWDIIEDEDVTTRPEKIIEQQEYTYHLYQEIEALPEYERNAIYCHYIKEMTLEETARKVGRAPSTVSKDVHQGLKKLRVRLVQ